MGVVSDQEIVQMVGTEDIIIIIYVSNLGYGSSEWPGDSSDGGNWR